MPAATSWWVSMRSSRQRRAAADTLRIGPEVEEEQRRRSRRCAVSATPATSIVRSLGPHDASEPTVNLMPALLEASRAYATLGEIVEALASVFGRWVEQPRI